MAASPFALASMRAEDCSALVVASTFAPAAASCRTMATWPKLQAKRSALLPSAVAASVAAPALSNSKSMLFYIVLAPVLIDMTKP